MFSALSAETIPSGFEPTTSNSISSKIAPSGSQTLKQSLQIRKKKRPCKTISDTTISSKPTIEIKMAPHKTKKSTPIQDTSDEEDMITYYTDDDLDIHLTPVPYHLTPTKNRK
ncbi:hypothetical protein TNCV_2273261 [Trichonephila clavipes]|nr:hypothetical protein TNCV_2273261 [Trichonephila clavipes]